MYLSFLHSAEDASAIHVDADTRIQVLDSVGDLPNADKEQCGAFLVSRTLQFLRHQSGLNDSHREMNAFLWYGRTSWIKLFLFAANSTIN